MSWQVYSKYCEQETSIQKDHEAVYSFCARTIVDGIAISTFDVIYCTTYEHTDQDPCWSPPCKWGSTAKRASPVSKFISIEMLDREGVHVRRSDPLAMHILMPTSIMVLIDVRTGTGVWRAKLPLSHAMYGKNMNVDQSCEGVTIELRWRRLVT